MRPTPTFFLTTKRQTGFSLLEVLVALVIIASGLMGMAGMNALAINNTSVARVRTIAALHAESLAASMGANATYWSGMLNTGQTSNYTPPTASFTVIGNTLGNTTLNGKSADCSSATCTPDEMAAYDLKQWGTNLAAQLPNGRGSIVCALTAATKTYTCKITITWTEKNLALRQASGTLSNTSVANTSYQLVVQP